MNLTDIQRPIAFLVTLLICSLVSGCDSSTPQETKDGSLRFVSSGGDKHFEKIGTNKWSYNHDSSAERQIWAAVFDAGETKGRKFAGSIKITSDQPVTLTLILARDGDTPYEGSGRTVVLQPNVSSTINLSHKFEKNYPRIKLQFDVVECNSPAVEFTIDNISLTEAPKP